jgi:hypothetical protein
MPHPLEEKLVSVRHRLWAVLAIGGLSRIIAVVVGLILFLSLADYLLRPADLGIRFSVSAVALATLCFMAYRGVYRPATRVPADVDMARGIEHEVPRLGNRFSSAIEFLRQPEDAPEAGSVVLRRAVIAQSTDEVQSLDPAQVVDLRTTLRPLAWAVAVCSLAAVAVLSNPPAAGTALGRLARPWHDLAWPRKHYLLMTSAPTRLAAGQTFEVELIDRGGPLPTEVRLHYRFEEDGQVREEVELMRLDGGVMKARRDDVRRPFDYRAEGGDDDTMPWISLRIMPPPKIESLRVTLYPPAYTGWPPTDCQPQIHALVGTRARIRGRTDRPMRRVTMQLEDGSAIAAQISADRHDFTVAAEDLVIERSAVYWFVLEDVDGLQGGQQQRWEVVAERDTSPRVVLQRPQTDLYLTPQATVPLQILVEDDLAIRDVALVGTRSDRNDSPDLVVPIFAGPPQPTRSAVATEVLSQEPRNLADHRVAAGGQTAQRKTFEFLWDLEPLAIAAGTEIAFQARAHDYLPQVGTSVPPRRIHVVSAVELDQRLGQRERQLRDDLQQTLELQRDIHGQGEALAKELQRADPLSQSVMDRLQAAEMNQRQVRQQLATGGGNCVAGQCQSVLSELACSQANRPAAARRLEELRAAIEQLDKDPLPAIDRGMTAASKAAQAAREDPQAKPPQPNAGAHLEEAGRKQKQVIDALEKLVKDLSKGLGYDRFRREIGQIRQRQQRLQQSTGQVARATLTLDFEELTAPQRAELTDLDHDQVDLGQQLDIVELEMEAASAAAERGDPAVAAKLTEAVATARGLDISGRMRETGRNVGRNHLGQAVTEQRQLVDDLTQVLEQLTRSDTGPSQQKKQTASSNGPKRQGKPPSKKEGKPGGSKPGEKGQKKGSKPGGSKPGGAKAGQKAGRAPTGTSRAGGRQTPGTVSAQQLLGEVWGHLPPRAQARLMQWSDEQFLPKYEPLIEQYFRRLAEEPPSAAP